ncbi:heparan-alpha-glucosaminide N-acetyltransferase domain-containing protein [Microbacterium sp. 179-B 1A2 NHS]|uniref:heparan-alpha-glucosaminide N-acetyltransferase domain-containing protein n=1 Tax=Microbacterium sp. 179-B 1A2 NHS TaxID=3142383 RepID=UPI0039A3C658
MAAPAAVTAAWRSWNGSARLAGVDLARALAVLGMLAAHLVEIDEPFHIGDPRTWIDVVNGRSSILFAVLAGVSIALVTGGALPRRGPALATARRRLAVRAALLWAIGLGLILTGVPVYVILPAYAILFLLALPLVALPPRVLWGVAASVIVVVPWLLPLWGASPVWDGVWGETLFLLVGWAYPFPLWIAFVLAGIAIGRADLRRVDVQVSLLAGGAVAVVTAGMIDVVLAGSGALGGDGYLLAVWSSAPHSSGILEALGSTGFAAAVLGACLLLCRTPATWAVAPLRAVGSMPLTAYVGQILVWAVVAALTMGDTGDLGGFREMQPFWWFVLGAVVFCTAWALLRGQGPIERMLAAIARRVVPEKRWDAADRVDT